jgi:hypothetical protein
MSRKSKEPLKPANTSELLVTYNEFFQSSLNKGLVRREQELELNVFFRELGLTNKEPLDKYLKALAKY